jgi:hypothetical protein
MPPRRTSGVSLPSCSAALEKFRDAALTVGVGRLFVSRPTGPPLAERRQAYHHMVTQSATVSSTGISEAGAP